MSDGKRTYVISLRREANIACEFATTTALKRSAVCYVLFRVLHILRALNSCALI